MTSTVPAPPVVVGVDGSADSSEALRWALLRAAQAHVPVRAVSCWSWPESEGYAGYGDLSLAGRTRAAAAAQVAEALSGLDVAGIDVDVVTLEGSPGGTLVEAASQAELLVVGSRGHGRLGTLLLGSVSTYCVTHAPCPVVVVRPQAGTRS